jgi:hypothetical protein
MGSGVEQNESFEALLEERLNRENAAEDTGTRYEVLNFGVAGYSPFHVLSQLKRKVFAFEPEAVLYLGHASDLDRASTRWATMVQRGIAPQDPYLTALLRQTGLRRDTKPNEARRRIRAYTDELLGWVYRQIVDDCRHRQIVPVFVYMETVTEPLQAWRAADRASVLALARDAGFLVLDLTGAYEGRPPADLWIRENDGHPNVLGNRLIAERLYALVQTRRRDLGLGDGPLADRDARNLTGADTRLAASSVR